MDRPDSPLTSPSIGRTSRLAAPERRAGEGGSEIPREDGEGARYGVRPETARKGPLELEGARATARS